MRKILSIASTTFGEIARDRIFYSFLIFLFLLMGAAYLASKLSFIAPVRIVLDFGQTSASLGLALFAIIQGASNISREYERRTIMLVSSKPVRMIEFVLGKFFGVAGVLFINTALLLLVEWIIIRVMEVPGFGAFYLSFFLIFLQSLFLTAVAMFFISFTTVTLSVVFSVGVFILGCTTTEFLASFSKIDDEGVRSVLHGIVYSFPSFEGFNLGYRLTYQFPITFNDGFFPFLYTAVYSLFLLFISAHLLKVKEY